MGRGERSSVRQRAWLIERASRSLVRYHEELSSASWTSIRVTNGEEITEGLVLWGLAASEISGCKRNLNEADAVGPVTQKRAAARLTY